MRTIRNIISAFIVVAVLAGCSIATTFPQASPSAPAVPTVDPSSPVVVSPSTSPSAEANDPCRRSGADTTGLSADEALLETLRVCFERGPVPDYARTQYFGEAWLDYANTGCDERNRVLRRDLTNVTIDNDGCRILTGTLLDPYTGATINFVRGQDTSALVQIDHVVALKDAWESGAYLWTQDERERLANDLDNLLAVDGAENASKGSGSAAEYLPRQEFECEYVRLQVSIKAEYNLSVMVDEKQVMASVLEGCS